MRASKPVAGLVAVGVLAMVVGGLYSLATGPIVGGTASLPFATTAAYVTLALAVVATALAVVLGSRDTGGTSNPYW